MHFEMITQNIGVWAYLLLALVVMVEGPVATLAGAVAAASGYMRPEGVFIAAASGNMLADSLWYSLGYLGRIEWLERYGRWLGVKSSLIQQVRGDIDRNAARILLIAKLTLGFSIPALIAAGLSRAPVRRWFPSLVLGETLWTGGLVLSGFYLTRYVQKFERGVETVALAGMFAGVVLVLFYLNKVRKNAGEKSTAGD